VEVPDCIALPGERARRPPRPDKPGFSGVPLHRILTTAGRQTTTEVTDVTRRRSPSTFEVPPDFTRKALGKR
jgi:hypothetical protein